MPRKSRNKANPADNKPINLENYRGLVIGHVSTVVNVNKPQKAAQIVFANCDFDYQRENLTVDFRSFKKSFNPTRIKVLFRKESVTSISYDSKEYKPSEIFSAKVSFARTCIDFFGFSKDRTFHIGLSFKSEGTSLQSTYEITLPVLKQSELRFKPPGCCPNDPITRQICKQGFDMTAENSKAEISRCIQLEEFKLLPVVDRYQAYGYISMLELFINIENSFERDLVQKFNISFAKLQKTSATNYKIDTPGQLPTAAASVCITPMSAITSNIDTTELKKLQINAPIVNYHRNYVTIEVRRNQKRIEVDEKYHIEFVPNLFSNAMAMRSLRRVQKYNYENFLLTFSKDHLPTQSRQRFQQFNEIEWLNQNVGANFAQSQAIQHIVNRTSFPSPYIVFGPPGTGKTSTLVEAVAQIVKLQPKAKVLITVNSNSACDEIGERLMKFVGYNKMYRLYAPSFSKKMHRVNPKLKTCSNLRYGYHIQPSVQELLSYNVVLSTLVNAGRLKSLPGTPYDYIFVDECASSAEPYVTIPISLAMKKGASFTPLIVLLGDHKQLGQILRTFHSERYGFNISMMERVMGMEKYKFQENSFDPRFIVQLTDNFRSHHSILSYSNKQFYNSILNAKQTERVANFAIGWEHLPNPKFPVIFHASWTKSETDGTSQFNNGDINFVRFYVNNLLKKGINGNKVGAKDIGIISPYAAQRERLLQVYPSGIEIGTVEYFQGREKLIVIVSGVRSKTPTIGFLKNEKRLNVALTRAKALLIVIGNPETLGKNVFWRKFIKMCCENKASTGNIPSWVWQDKKSIPDTEEDEDDVVRLEEMMNGLEMDD